MERRKFLQTMLLTGAGVSVSSLGAAAAGGSQTLDSMVFDSAASLLNASNNKLTTDQNVAVWAESTATNTDSDGNGDATDYGSTKIPLVAIEAVGSGTVVGVGTPFVNDGVDFSYGSDEFMLNVLDEYAGSGSVQFDESHDQYYGLSRISKFEAYAENNGYTVDTVSPSGDIQSGDLSGDALVVTSASSSFSSSEQTAVSNFVSDGGLLVLLSQSDFDNFDETANMNALASAVGAGFRFNDDQVVDSASNAGQNYQPVTGRFNTTDFPSSLFQDRDGIDEALGLDPSKTYTVDVVNVTDGDTVDVRFSPGQFGGYFPNNGRKEEIRVLGIDTPEKKGSGQYERPAEWEGLVDRVGLQRVEFEYASSLVDANRQPLTDSNLVAAVAETDATQVDTNLNGNFVSYGSDQDIPLLAIQEGIGPSNGAVAGVGSQFVLDDTLANQADLDNEELYLNLWDDLLPDGATVRWWDSSNYSYAYFEDQFGSYAESNGYTVNGGTTVPSDTTSVDGLVLHDLRGGLTNTQLSNLASFVDDGGVVLLHKKEGNDATSAQALNDAANEIGVGFRFNDDRVEDATNNTDGAEKPTTTRFDPTFTIYDEREGLDDELSVSPSGTTVQTLSFDAGTASLLNDSKNPLTDSSLVAVWAESNATNTDADGNGDAVSYPSNTDIPVVAVDGNVAGIGSPLVNDGDLDKASDNEEFLLNLWDDLLGGSGTVRWDESHGQFYPLSKFSDFESYAENNGYTVNAGAGIPSDTSSVDGLVVTSPGSFTSSELSDLSSFVTDGGVVILHDQSDYSDFDLTSNLDAIATELGVGFRFNDDQVTDSSNNAGDNFKPTTTNFNTSSFSSLFAQRAGLDDTAQYYWDADYPYLAYHARLATDFAKQKLAGETVDISFDQRSASFNGGVTDPFGRLLAYIHYDDGSGSRDTLYNQQLVENGYARYYASTHTNLDAFFQKEQTARANSTGVWTQSNPQLSPKIRDRSVSEVYVPNAARVTSTQMGLNDGRTVVYAESSATPSNAPLVALDRNRNLAMVGGLLIDEGYESAEDFPVDTSGYDNFTLLANVVEALSDKTGPVLVEGGHGQFNAGYALAGEDVAYFQRYLEGFDIDLEAINDLSKSRLQNARALVLTTPPAALSTSEIDELSTFVGNGGAVLLMGDAQAPDSARSNLNAIAEGLGSDLRLDSAAVTDSTANLDGNDALPTTQQFSGTLSLYSKFSPTADIDTESVTLSVSDPTPDANTSVTGDVVLSELSDGLAGYEVTVSLADTSVAEITGANYPSGFGFTQSPTVANDGSSVTLKATDTDDNYQSTVRNLTLATVSFDVTSTGSTALSLSVSKLDDDDGDAVSTVTGAGTLSVSAPSVSPVVNGNTPQDPDNDGIYEDVDGDGQVTVQDARVIFEHIDDQSVESQSSLFDLNSNGRVDFDDVNELYDEA